MGNMASHDALNKSSYCDKSHLGALQTRIRLCIKLQICIFIITPWRNTFQHIATFYTSVRCVTFRPVLDYLNWRKHPSRFILSCVSKVTYITPWLWHDLVLNSHTIARSCLQYSICTHLCSICSLWLWVWCRMQPNAGLAVRIYLSRVSACSCVTLLVFLVWEAINGICKCDAARRQTCTTDFIFYNFIDQRDVLTIIPIPRAPARFIHTDFFASCAIHTSASEWAKQIWNINETTVFM